MRRRSSLLVIVLAAAALSLVGVFREAGIGRADIPQPVRPAAPSDIVLSGLSSTELGVTVDARSESGGNPGGHGIRGNLYTQYGRGTYGNADIGVNDGDPLGFFLVTTDIGCDATGPTDYDSVAAPEPAPGGDLPYTFDEASSDLMNTGKDYLLPQLAPYPISAVFFTNITTIWFFGGTFAYTLNPALPLNIVTMQVPWMPGSAITQIWTGGGPGKPAGQTCSDSAGGLAISETDGSATDPVGTTGNPEAVGDSAAPCDPGATECADKQVHGFWAYPAVVEEGSVDVTLRVLNNGPEATGDFKDVWHVEAPDGVNASWAGAIDRKDWNGSAFEDGADPVVSPPAGGEEISYSEDNVPVGTPVEYNGTLNVSCAVDGDYVVVIKAVAYPKTGTTDNDLATNVAMSSIRVQCPADAEEVDKQVITLSPRITALSVTSEPLNLPFGSGPEGEDPNGEHVQLLVGDTATLSFITITRNQSEADEEGKQWLVAEAPDLAGDGTYDITVDWDETSVSAVYGSMPSNQTPITPSSVSCISGGGMDCAGLDIALLEPNGPQIATTAEMDITCDAAGRYLVPVKSVDMPVGKGDSNIANNVTWSPVTVYCWNSAPDKTAADDGTDDNTGIYPRWTTRETSAGNADIRKSVPPYPATGMSSDTQYVERWIEGECYWFDEEGTPPGADTWVTGAESRASAPAGIDNDEDCLADAALAQPGRPVDQDDEPDVGPGSMCDPIVYNEGTGPFNSVQYNKAADMDCDGLLDGWEKAIGSNPRLVDSDSDGVSDFFEMFMFTNPVNPDTDGDGVFDKPEDDYVSADAGGHEGSGPTLEADNADDNCPLVANPDQDNWDGGRRPNGGQISGDWASNPNADKLGDACDTDDDNDSVLDVAEEVAPTTLPHNPDSDGDRCLDGVELMLGKDPNSAGSKCPATLTPDNQKYWRGCHINVPDSSVWGDFASESEHAWYEMDVDGDGIDCSASAITDADSDNGTGNGAAAKDEFTDIVEAMGYGTKIASKDTDGDGCEDWIEIVDVNGDRSANISDVLLIARRAFNLLPADPVSDAIFDINKDGSLNLTDPVLGARNSSLVKSHSLCPTDS